MCRSVFTLWYVFHVKILNKPRLTQVVFFVVENTYFINGMVHLQHDFGFVLPIFLLKPWIIYDTMPSFICYINNAVINTPIYLFCICVSYHKLRITILSDFMYLYRTVRHTECYHDWFVSIMLICIGKYTKDNHLSTLASVHCGLPVT